MSFFSGGGGLVCSSDPSERTCCPTAVETLLRHSAASDLHQAVRRSSQPLRLVLAQSASTIQGKSSSKTSHHDPSGKTHPYSSSDDMFSVTWCHGGIRMKIATFLNKLSIIPVLAESKNHSGGWRGVYWSGRGL